MALRPFIRAIGAGEVERAQMRGEAGGLAEPVGDEAGGADDESRIVLQEGAVHLPSARCSEG